MEGWKELRERSEYRHGFSHVGPQPHPTAASSFHTAVFQGLEAICERLFWELWEDTLLFKQRTKQTNLRKVREGISECPDFSQLAFPFPALCILSPHGHTFFLISVSQGPFLSLLKETLSSFSGHWATSRSNTCNSLSKGAGLNGRGSVWKLQPVWKCRDRCKGPGVGGGGHKRQGETPHSIVGILEDGWGTGLIQGWSGKLV